MINQTFSYDYRPYSTVYNRNRKKKKNRKPPRMGQGRHNSGETFTASVWYNVRFERKCWISPCRRHISRWEQYPNAYLKCVMTVRLIQILLAPRRLYINLMAICSKGKKNIYFSWIYIGLIEKRIGRPCHIIVIYKWTLTLF